MAKKRIAKVSKLQFLGGGAKPGPALASAGINMPQFCTDFNNLSPAFGAVQHNRPRTLRGDFELLFENAQHRRGYFALAQAVKPDFTHLRRRIRGKLRIEP